MPSSFLQIGAFQTVAAGRFAIQPQGYEGTDCYHFLIFNANFAVGSEDQTDAPGVISKRA
jgi:hypothetical protein